MTEKMMESVITELVVNGGDARGKALAAVKAARENDMETADRLMKECGEALTKAHEFQTTLIQQTISGETEMATSLIMVHGQDHLMDAMVVRDLAVEMIEMYKLFHGKMNKK